jgi:hypothetical protein
MDTTPANYVDYKNLRELSHEEKIITSGGKSVCYRYPSNKANTFRFRSAYGYYVKEQWNGNRYAFVSSVPTSADFNGYCRNLGFNY